MKVVRTHLPSPAMIVACVALLVALGGVSYAAAFIPRNSVGTAELKKGAVTSAKLRKDSVTGATVKNGSLTAADFKRGQLPRGPKGDPGIQGPHGNPGPKGDTGPAGPFPDVLPTGKTLRGEYTAYGDAANAGVPARDAISFAFSLATDPAAEFIPEGGPADANCPGSAINPQAAPGYLCVYENVNTSGASGSIIVPSKYGAIIKAQSNAAGLFGTTGTWAVTGT